MLGGGVGGRAILAHWDYWPWGIRLVKASPAVLSMWPLQKHLSHPSSVVYFLATPPIKLKLFTAYNLTSVWDRRVHLTRGRSWRTDYPLVLAACHKLGQDDPVRSLHEQTGTANRWGTTNSKPSGRIIMRAAVTSYLVPVLFYAGAQSCCSDWGFGLRLRYFGNAQVKGLLSSS